jgi:endoglucanase
MVLQAEYFSLIKEAGFSGVRIPIRWSAHAGVDSPYTIHKNFKDRVDWAVHQALTNELAVVINIHHYEEIMSEPEQHRERFLALWKQITEHYLDQPDDLLFEVMNEPHDNFVAELWNEYLLEAIDTIRAIDPERTLIIGTAEWGGIGSLSKLDIPDSLDNIIVTVHYYNPFEFTHQGAEWVDGSDDWMGTTWRGYTSEKSAMAEDLDMVAAWAAQHNRPIYIGEFGSYSKADMTSRVAWTKHLREEAEQRGMSWAYGEFGAGFGIYDRDSGEWRTELLHALIPQ